MLMITSDRTANQVEKPKLHGKVHVLHMLLWTASVLCVLGTLSVIMVPFIRDAEHQVTSDEAPLLIALGTIAGVISINSIVAAVLLGAGNPLAKTLSLVTGIMLIPFIPFGTAIGVGILITRASNDTSQYLAAANTRRHSTV